MLHSKQVRLTNDRAQQGLPVNTQRLPLFIENFLLKKIPGAERDEEE